MSIIFLFVQQRQQLKAKTKTPREKKPLLLFLQMWLTEAPPPKVINFSQKGGSILPSHSEESTEKRKAGLKLITEKNETMNILVNFSTRNLDSIKMRSCAVRPWEQQRHHVISKFKSVKIDVEDRTSATLRWSFEMVQTVRRRREADEAKSL